MEQEESHCEFTRINCEHAELVGFLFDQDNNAIEATVMQPRPKSWIHSLLTGFSHSNEDAYVRLHFDGVGELQITSLSIPRSAFEEQFVEVPSTVDRIEILEDRCLIGCTIQELAFRFRILDCCVTSPAEEPPSDTPSSCHA